MDYEALKDIISAMGLVLSENTAAWAVACMAEHSALGTEMRLLSKSLQEGFIDDQVV